MRIFLGSSREAKSILRKIEDWLPAGWAMPWYAPGTFRHGRTTWEELLRHSKDDDGAIFVFAQDDLTVSRGSTYRTTRDNIWLEYGLFVGSLGLDRVCAVVVGKPKRPTNLHGVTLINIPRDPISSTPPTNEKISKAMREIKIWSKRLTPIRLRGLTAEVATSLASREQINVESILTHKAESFLRPNTSGQIIALCSNKGTFSKHYYGEQFKWVRRKPKSRRLRRVFVRMRGMKRSAGFSPGELRGIRMHLKEYCKNIKIRWVWEDDKALGGEYGDSLGFAVFKNKWLVHWGLKSGYCYKKPADTSVAKLLSKMFATLWDSGTRFDDRTLKKMFRDEFVSNHPSI